jgi:hypothetical protein
MSHASHHIPPEIDQALRTFDSGQFRRAVESLQSMVSAADDRGELARLCLNLIHEVTTDMGRASPPSGFNLRQQLILALGDANDDVDDLLLWDDLSDPPPKMNAPRLAPSQNSPPPRPAPELPPLLPKRNQPHALEQSLLPPMMGDAGELSSFSQLGEPLLPDEANLDSLFDSGLLGGKSHISNGARTPHASQPAPTVKTPADPGLKDPKKLPNIKDARAPKSPSVSPLTPASPFPPADATPIQSIRSAPPSPPPTPDQQNIHRPKNFSDIKAASADRMRNNPDARHPSGTQNARVSASSMSSVVSIPGSEPAPSSVMQVISDPTPPAPPSAVQNAFQQAQNAPATRPRYQNPLPPLGGGRVTTPRAALPPSPSNTHYATRCRDLLARNLPLDALRCLIEHLKSPDANPSDPTTISLQQTIEQALRAQAIHFLEPLSRIPSLRATPATLMARSDLDHRAGYLISQIDGITPLEFLLDLNAMPRQDAALLLLKLIEHGIIAFE